MRFELTGGRLKSDKQLFAVIYDDDLQWLPFLVRQVLLAVLAPGIACRSAITRSASRRRRPCGEATERGAREDRRDGVERPTRSPGAPEGNGSRPSQALPRKHLLGSNPESVSVFELSH
jgi:hypothetical protein